MRRERAGGYGGGSSRVLAKSAVGRARLRYGRSRFKSPHFSGAFALKSPKLKISRRIAKIRDVDRIADAIRMRIS